ncbi:unnamed protein product [Rodentolepis nana]|uniref:Col_cuticle_N domain-containing protein n=1 Tax=Rodentolepis nana TaxID=102285 RepID=A0A0R3TY27_RODNA|nr:unnamed protein product [Rodentolepis nana]
MWVERILPIVPSNRVRHKTFSVLIFTAIILCFFVGALTDLQKNVKMYMNCDKRDSVKQTKPKYNYNNRANNFARWENAEDAAVDVAVDVVMTAVRRAVMTAVSIVGTTVASALHAVRFP